MAVTRAKIYEAISAGHMTSKAITDAYGLERKKVSGMLSRMAKGGFLDSEKRLDEGTSRIMWHYSIADMTTTDERPSESIRKCLTSSGWRTFEQIHAENIHLTERQLRSALQRMKAKGEVQRVRDGSGAGGVVHIWRLADEPTPQPPAGVIDTIIADGRESGSSWAEVALYLNQCGYTTKNGCRWTSKNVCNRYHFKSTGTMTNSGISNEPVHASDHADVTQELRSQRDEYARLLERERKEHEVTRRELSRVRLEFERWRAGHAEA
jgi:predicted transcriptional regulator